MNIIFIIEITIVVAVFLLQIGGFMFKVTFFSFFMLSFFLPVYTMNNILNNSDYSTHSEHSDLDTETDSDSGTETESDIEVRESNVTLSVVNKILRDNEENAENSIRLTLDPANFNRSQLIKDINKTVAMNHKEKGSAATFSEGGMINVSRQELKKKASSREKSIKQTKKISERPHQKKEVPVKKKSVTKKSTESTSSCQTSAAEALVSLSQAPQQTNVQSDIIMRIGSTTKAMWERLNNKINANNQIKKK